jgi:antitoxin component YwqK of YwqJK toxin-antitoxin module
MAFHPFRKASSSAAPRPDERAEDVAEVRYESGALKFRYARRLSGDGTTWVRDGRFVAYFEDGAVASERFYRDGLGTGIWRDYHANGRLAAVGEYRGGVEVGDWKYWNFEGRAAN